MGMIRAARDVRTIRLLLTGAEEEARRSGEEMPGPEHLLLSALALPDGSAARALREVGVEHAQLAAAIEQVHAGALAAVGIDAEQGPGATAELHGRARGSFRSTPQAQQVFRAAVALSKTARPAQLSGADVVAAICDLERGTVARALVTLGVDRDRLRRAAQQARVG